MRLRGRRRARFHAVVCLMVASLLGVQGLQPSASNERSPSRASLPRQPGPAIVPRRWSEFQFAPNGVCISPERFVVIDGPSKHHDDDDDDGKATSSAQSFTLRNVPGDGDCMIQAVALASFASVGLGANNVLLRAITKELRDLTARVLEQTADHDMLVVQGQRLVTAAALLQSATRQEGLASTDEYLRLLRLEGRDGGLYGGGPELTVLCNLLRRPISIYEMAKESDIDSSNSHHGNDDGDTISSTTDEKGVDASSSSLRSYCPIVHKGTFGGRLFRDPLATVPQSAVQSLRHPMPGAYSWHLHILVVETSDTLKHACVLLPQDD